MLKLINGLALLYLTVAIISCANDGGEAPNIPEEGEYELVWFDEFDGAGAIDEDKWFHQTLLPNGDSWFNGELQHYTNRTDNSYLADGYLHIVAKRENFTEQGRTKNFTSARLNSKFAFTYGRVEISAKLPKGRGTWPAMWTLGQNITENGGYWASTNGITSWPACGEIDIMEHWGFNQDVIQAALHTPSSSGNTQNKGSIQGQNVSDTFHTYVMQWSADKIGFYFDDTLYYTYNPSTKNAQKWPFTANQYILLNIAMGGIGGEIDPAFTESEMVIDYVRIFQRQ